MPLLYKYRNVSDPLLMDRLGLLIRMGEFWFANATEVNDPFEFRCNVMLSWDFEKTAEAFALVELHRNPECGYPAALTKARTVLGDLSKHRLLERQWELSYNLWRELARRFTMCCLADTPTSILMWSHYAANHTGVAVEIEVPDQCLAHSLHGTVHRVDYSDELAAISPLSLVDGPTGIRERVFESLFLRKSECWSYEREWRILRLSKQEELYMQSHSAKLPAGCRITRLILGSAASVDTREQLKNLLARDAPNVSLAYALPSDHAKFGLEVVDAKDVEASQETPDN